MRAPAAAATRHHSAPLSTRALSLAALTPSCTDAARRKGVIEYNSREEMEDAIRKLDSTRVGDRGENLIRVYKVCAGHSQRCLLGRRVALSGVGLLAAAA